MKIYTARDIDEKMELEGGLTATVRIERDEDMGPPWEENDCYGKVSKWERRDKRAGERILCESHGAKRFYDYAGAIQTAKKEGWDAPPFKTGTKGEQAVRAVERDFEHLQDWCEDRWHYAYVIVTLRDAKGKEAGVDSLGGVEDSDGYDREQAAEMLNQLLTAYAEEVKEAESWAARDSVTVQNGGRS